MRLFARKQQAQPYTPHYELRLYESIQVDKTEWAWTLYWHEERYGDMGLTVAQGRAATREEAIEQGEQARQLSERRRAARSESIVLGVDE